MSNPTSSHDHDVEESLTLRPRFDAAGLVTCVATDAAAGDVLMINGNSNGTLDGGKIHYSFDGTSLKLNGTDSLAAYQAALDAVTFSTTDTTIPARTTFAPSIEGPKLPDRVRQERSLSTSAPTGEGAAPPLPEPGPPTTRARSACVISTWRGFEPS